MQEVINKGLISKIYSSFSPIVKKKERKRKKDVIKNEWEI